MLPDTEESDEDSHTDSDSEIDDVALAQACLSRKNKGWWTMHFQSLCSALILLGF